MANFHHVVVNSRIRNKHESTTTQADYTLQELFPFGSDRDGNVVPIHSPQEWGWTVSSVQHNVQRLKDSTSPEKQRITLLWSMVVTALQTHDEYKSWLQYVFRDQPLTSVKEEDRIRCDEEYRSWKSRQQQSLGATLPTPSQARHLERALNEVLISVQNDVKTAAADDEDGNHPCAEEVQRWVDRVRTSPLTMIPRGSKFQVTVESPESEDEDGALLTATLAPGSIHPQYTITLQDKPPSSKSSTKSQNNSNGAKPEDDDTPSVSPLNLAIVNYTKALKEVSTGPTSPIARDEVSENELCDLFIHSDKPLDTSAPHCHTFQASMMRNGSPVTLAVKRQSLNGWGKALRRAHAVEVEHYHKFVRHPNVCMVYGSSYTQATKEITTAMELVLGHSAASLRLPLPEKATQALLRVVYKALDHLSSAGIIVCYIPFHRIVGVGTDTVKICPITIAETFRDRGVGCVDGDVDVAALPPEIAKTASFAPQCSTWALGMLGWTLLTGSSSRSPSALPPLQISKTCITFLNECLEINPEERKTIAQLYGHAFLS